MSMSKGWLATGAGIWLLSVAWLSRARSPASPPHVLVWLALAPPFGGVGVAELLHAGASDIRQWAAWEGKNYLCFLTPLLACAAAEATVKRANPLS